MASPVESNEFRFLLNQNISKVWESKYKDLPSAIDALYNMQSSDKWAEEFQSVTGLPDIPAFGGKITYLPMYPGFYTRIEHQEFAGGVQFERKLMDDKKFNVLNARTDSLFTAATRTKDKYKVRPLAYATSTAFDFQYSEEGVSLASNSHLTKAGTSTTYGFDNLGTSALSKTSVAATRLAMKQFRNDISERIDVGDDLVLVVPDELEEAAFEIVKTPKGLDTAEGNQNFHYGRYEILSLPRLSDYDTNNWALVWKSQAKQDFMWFDRVKPEPKQTWDFDTYILKLAIYMRFSNGFTDWRWIFHNQVS